MVHYRVGSSSSSRSNESWDEHIAQAYSQSLSPVPIPNAPYLQTVSLPGASPITNAPYLQTISLPGPSPIMNASYPQTVYLPRAPHLHTVSLPHPHATSYPSPMPYQNSSTRHPSLMVLHPLLSRGPNLMFNVTQDVAHVQLRPDCPPIRLHEHAVYSPVSHMTIAIFGFPAWSIDVVNPRGITVNDVLFKIRELLNQSVSSHEMHGPLHAVAIDAFKARSRVERHGWAQDMKRFDFLGPRVFFAGLTRAPDGSDSWDLHLSQKV